MKRFALVIISSCVMLFAFAQEEIVFDTIPKIKKDSDVRSLNMTRPEISGESFSPEQFNLFDPALFHQPLLPDYTKNLDFKKYLNPSGFTGTSFSTYGFGYSPFLTGERIFNQSAFRLNEQFLIGGNSFGARSVFDQPGINSSIQDMSTKGASMFIQYKVSKNFKVETRLSISNRQTPWIP